MFSAAVFTLMKAERGALKDGKNVEKTATLHGL